MSKLFITKEATILGLSVMSFWNVETLLSPFMKWGALVSIWTIAMKRHRLSQIVFSWMVPCGKIAKKIKMKDRLIRGGLHRRLRGIF